MLFELLSRWMWLWRLALRWKWRWLNDQLLLGHTRDVIRNRPELVPELRTMLNAFRLGENPDRDLERRALLAAGKE